MSDNVQSQQVVESRSFERTIRSTTRGYPAAKRAFDIIVAAFLLIIIAPVFCLISCGIIISGQLPLYSHVRIGRGGKEFYCLKFRSMRNDADAALARLLERDPSIRHEWETSRKLRFDPRVTRIGKILRSTSLDELPQLLNVLAGQMSLVGPRPVTRDEFEKFYGQYEGAAYISIRPGLTGLWQVSGRSQIGYSNRVALDTHYVHHSTFWSDLFIIFQTIGVVIRRGGAW